VGSDTVKILLAVLARKLPSAALIQSNQLVRGSKIRLANYSESFVAGKAEPRPPLLLLPVLFHDLNASFQSGFDRWS
jgi:hypothetical protein